MSLSLAPEYKEIAEKVQDKFSTTFSHIDLDQVLFIKEENKGGKNYATTRVVKEPYNFITNYKFIITVYEPLVIGMNEAQKNILILHELLHINDNFDGLIKHDTEDFKVVLSKFGLDWPTNPSVKDPLIDEE